MRYLDDVVEFGFEGAAVSHTVGVASRPASQRQEQQQQQQQHASQQQQTSQLQQLPAPEERQPAAAGSALSATPATAKQAAEVRWQVGVGPVSPCSALL